MNIGFDPHILHVLLTWISILPASEFSSLPPQHRVRHNRTVTDRGDSQQDTVDYGAGVRAIYQDESIDEVPVGQSYDYDYQSIDTVQELQEWKKELFPNPQTDYKSCGLEKPGYVCDPARMLNGDEVAALEESLQVLCDDVPSPCNDTGRRVEVECRGVRAAIAVVSKFALPPIPGGEVMLDSLVYTSRRQEAHEWALYLRNSSWQFGRCDNDLVIVFSLHDRKVYTSVGEPLQSAMTKACANAVYQDSKPYLLAGHYATALRRIVHDYRFVLNKDFKCKISYISVLPTGTIIGIIFALVCIPIMSCVICVFVGPCCKSKAGKNPNMFKKYRYHQTDDYDLSADIGGASSYM